MPHHPLHAARRLGDPLPEGESQGDGRTGPQQGPREVQEQEKEEGHRRDAGQRRHDGVHPGEELREQDGGALPPVESVHGPLQARVRIERNPAKVIEHRFPTPSPDVIPDPVRQERPGDRDRHDERYRGVPRGGVGPREHQHRERRDREPDVLQEGEEKDRREAVPGDEAREVVHRLPPLRFLPPEDRTGGDGPGDKLPLFRGDIALHQPHRAAAVDDPRAGEKLLLEDGPEVVDLDLEGGERLSLPEGGGERHPHCRVRQRAQDPAVDRSHRVVVPPPGVHLEA